MVMVPEGIGSLWLMELNERTSSIIGAAMKVHSALGPGLLESAYQACLAHELVRRGHQVRQKVAIPVRYEGVVLPVGYQADIVVEDLVIVEIKAVQQLHPIHEAQLLSYLRLTEMRVGLLLNFHAIHLKDSIRRILNGW